MGDLFKYRESYKLTKKYGTSYYFATMLLGKQDRRHIYALYSLCRYADDLVDVHLDQPGMSSTAEVDLKQFKEDVVKAIEDNYSEPDLLGAISTTWNELDLPLEYIERFFHSMEMDLTVTKYETFDDLLVYMDGSAAVIGEMVLPVLEKDSTKHGSIREGARALGNAFQLTNFLRDVGEDLKRGRCYIPQTDLKEYGVDPENIVYGNEFKNLLRFEIQRNREIYDEALPGIEKLAGRSRSCVRTAKKLYSGILDEIELNDFDVISKRARLSKSKKIFTAFTEFIR